MFLEVKTWMPGTSSAKTRFCPGMTSVAALRRRVGEAIVFELVAQRGLQNLAGRRMRDAVDESDVVGHPPFGDLAVHELEDVLARGLLALLELHDQQRPLVPFGVEDADYSGLGHSGVGDREVLQVDRGYPFAAGFDHVLGTVGDPHIAGLVDGR